HDGGALAAPRTAYSPHSRSLSTMNSTPRIPLFVLGALLTVTACSTPAGSVQQPELTPVPPEVRVPDWAADAVWYQIFPERFRNGDPTNDPTRASLEFPIDRVPESWEI